MIGKVDIRFIFQTNTFQLVLVCDDTHTFAIFNYGHQMDWTGAQGDPMSGLGGETAMVCSSFVHLLFYYFLTN